MEYNGEDGFSIDESGGNISISTSITQSSFWTFIGQYVNFIGE